MGLFDPVLPREKAQAFAKLSLAKFPTLRTTETEFCGISLGVNAQNTTLMGVRTEQRTAALVRQKALHVVPKVTLIDMCLGRGLALWLVGFC